MIQIMCRSCLRLWDAISVSHRTSCPYCGGALDER